MPDLSKYAGFTLNIGESNRLSFGNDVQFEKMSIRTFSDLKPVVKDQNLELSDDPAYYMYRNVRKKGDEDIIQKRGIRFDLTVIPPAKLGDEFIKTAGHYHPQKLGTAYAYPELYFVISGQATYLMQKKSAGTQIEDVILAQVKAGQPIIMPCDYGHVTVNELNEPLVMANWVESTFQSIYSDYEELRGAAYYILNNFGLPKLEPNPNYPNLPEIRELKVKPVVLEKVINNPIYEYLNDKDLKLLIEPENFRNHLALENLFEV